MRTLPPRHRRRQLHRHDDRGFTLVELMIVVVVIGVLAAIGSANYVRLRQNAQRASCVSNQHHVMTFATMYGIEESPGDVVLTLAQLRAAGFGDDDFGECPRSGDDDYDDYTVDFVDDDAVDVDCVIMGDDHPFAPPGS